MFLLTSRLFAFGVHTLSFVDLVAFLESADFDCSVKKSGPESTMFVNFETDSDCTTGEQRSVAELPVWANFEREYPAQTHL